MTAERKAIRLHVANLLKDKTAAGEKVFASRAFPVWDQELPVVLVYTNAEQSEILNEAPREYRRTVRLVVEALAKADQGVDDILDDMAEAIEQAMALDDTLAGKATDCRVSQVDLEVVDGGEKAIAALRLSYDVQYVKLAPVEQPEPIVSAFEGADVKMDIAVADGRIDSTQTINLPQ
jgi:hypothetical protein